MSALAFDFTTDGVATAPHPRRRLYAVRGTVDEPTVTRRPEPQAVATLDAVLAGTWAALTAGNATACPVCAATLRPRRSPRPGVTGGCCDGCGSSLE